MANTRFFTQIPAWVDDLDNVSDFQVRLLGFIYTLSNTGQQAFPSNNFLAKQYRKSPSTVQNALSDLYQKGLLKSTPKYIDGTNRIEKRYLEIIKPKSTDKYPMPEIGHTTEIGQGVCLKSGKIIDYLIDYLINQYIQKGTRVFLTP